MERARGGVALLSRIRIVERTGSTNADLLADTSAKEGDWLIALMQDAGRGRQGRQWVSASGNFFGSTLVELRPDDPPAPSFSLAAGLALIEALDTVTPGAQLLLKWPNDLMLGGRKLAGILLERSGERVVVGFGINLAIAPDLQDRPTASLDGRIIPEAVAPLLAASFARLLMLWRTAEPHALAKAWLARSHPVETRLTLHASASETLTGTFAGIDPDGALRLRRDDGSVEVVRAGDVSLG